MGAGTLCGGAHVLLSSLYVKRDLRSEIRPATDDVHDENLKLTTQSLTDRPILKSFRVAAWEVVASLRLLEQL